ncbi:MAG: hypothetical protein Q4P18_06665 [Methanobrevibacter sp.]|uniref:hypothetical protein n=1 Tax=Methanobrevibacter sp. TaxID=66852 RepID=UPI0026E10D6D|nr:hypothetical protein [Methanobrevibacter sp.]MDO5849198.1 hypothetical protein [Methanobrevibacter sp.]
MKYKKAIIYGILSWALVYIISKLIHPFIVDNVPYIDVTIPISIIIVTGVFGVAYIRNIDSNEVIEGFKLGILFYIIDVLCDIILFHITNGSNVLVQDYTLHLLSMLIMIPLITTFIGYLAQMEIELR